MRRWRLSARLAERPGTGHQAVMSLPDILCIGAVHWDVIGRAARALPVGADVPGEIGRRPGGVALNIARALARQGCAVGLLSSVGTDAEGTELVAACEALGLDTRFLHRGAMTDIYLALESQGVLVGAVADGRALEAAGRAILDPLADGRLGRDGAPWASTAVIDANLAPDAIDALADLPLLSRARLRLVPASPAKAARLVPLMRHPQAVLHLNRAEAEAICGSRLATARAAAEALLALGCARVVVTDGPCPAADGCREAGVLEALPPAVPLRRITGAGDAFLAAHLAAEWQGVPRPIALQAALAAAATHVSGDDSP